jgi:hypothetical protein
MYSSYGKAGPTVGNTIVTSNSNNQHDSDVNVLETFLAT